MKLLFIISTSLFYLTANSQSSLIGVIKGTQNEPIVAASIILRDDANKIIAYTYTNEIGEYILQTEKTGRFNMIINSMGFEQKSLEVDLNNVNKVKDIILNPKTTELKEVVIKSKRTFLNNGDKIIFDANSYLQGNEEVVEDLLKKIPGLSVSSDGTVRVGSQEVEKIMIDGDDMFEKGYKILTKNMPVSPIDKIELYQNYSNNKHLKGIEKSEKVALNLTLKEDSKRIWFGNILTGYAVDVSNLYELKANLMNFGNKNKHYFLTNLNSIGFDPIGDIDNLIRPYRKSEPGSIGDDQSSQSLLRMGIDLPNMKQKRINFNNAEMLSLNSIFTLSDKVKLKSLGFLNTDENDLFKNSLLTFALGSNQFVNTENFVGRKVQITGFGKIDLIYDISKNKTIEYFVKFNKSNKKNTSDLVFNNDLLNERLDNDNQLIDQKLLFTYKFSENKAVLLSGRYIYEKTDEDYSVNQFIFENLFSENANNTKQFSQNKMQFTGIEAHLLDKKKNGNLMEIKIGNQLRIDNLNTQFQLFNNELSVAFPDNYQNFLTYSINDLYLQGKYRFKFGKYSLFTQSDFHHILNKQKNSVEKNKQNSFFVIPKIGLEWKISEKSTIVSSYTYNTINASVLDVYPGYVQTSFRVFSKGDDEFSQLNSSSSVLNYTYGNWGDNFFGNAILLYSKNNDFYSTNSFITQNYIQSEKILIKDREFMSFSSNIDRFFKPVKSNLKLVFSFTKTNFKNIVNSNNLREVKNFTTDYGFEFRSGFIGFINYHIGSKWIYNQVKTNSENSYTNNISFLDLYFKINDKFFLQLQSERYFYGNLDKESNQYYFLDIEARYTVKENKLTFSLLGNNLFNTNTFKNYSISDINISKTEYALLPRYIFLKMEFRF